MPLASMSKVTSICGHAARCRRNAHQFEPAQRLVVGRHLALTLKHVDVHRRLAVGGRGEDLALAGRDGRVRLDQLGHDPAQGLDTQGERGHVQQQHVFDLAFEHAALNGRADRHHLVRVDPFVGFLAEEFLHLFLHRGIRVMPPTRMTSSISRGSGRHPSGPPAGPSSFSTRSSTSDSSLARVSFMFRCLGPLASAVMKGRLMSVSIERGELDLGLFRSFLQPLQAPFCRCAGRCPGLS